MKIENKEIAKFDLTQSLPETDAVLHLSDADDARWAGIVTLAPSRVYTLPALSRHDIYVLHGSVEAGGVLLDKDGFASLCDAGELRAGSEGVKLFIYRESAPVRGKAITQRGSEREWHAGRNPGMRVSTLSSSGYPLTLVAWQPNTHTRDHGHLNGEEILVLSGELRSQDQRYPAGTWIRLHPGARHEPFTEIPTVIMLRNGHLNAAS